MTTTLDHDARELGLYLENDERTYRAYLVPMAKNLAKKYDRGTFVYELAVKGFGHVVNAAAKEYRREFGSMSDAWFRMFPKQSRDALAELLTNEFLNDIRSGERWWN